MRAKRHGSTENALRSNGITDCDSQLVRDSGRNTVERVNEFNLTEKQECFAQAVAKGATLIDAYKASYNASSMKTGTIYSEASKLMDRPHIAERVKALLAIRQEKTFAVDAQRVRQHVFDRLMVESVDAGNPAASRIRALELLGKMDVVQMFKETKEVKDDRPDPTMLEAKLRAALERLVGLKAKDITPKKGKDERPTDIVDIEEYIEGQK